MSSELLSAPIERFDAKNKTYTTSAGVVFKLRPIGPGAIDHKRAQFNKVKGEPEVPQIEVNHGKGRTSWAPNYKDEYYQAAVQEHNIAVGRKLIEWILGTGIEVEVPETPKPGSVFEAALPEPDANMVISTLTRKYLYINSVMDSNDYAFLLEAIVGQQGVTQLGLTQAAADFPDNS